MLTAAVCRGKPESLLGRGFYARVQNNPVLYADPNGEITILAGVMATGIGGLVNAGVNLGGQLIANGGDMSGIEWLSVGVSFVSGAVATGLAVATVGASVVASGAISSTADYLMYNGLTGGDVNMQGLAIAAVTGGATGGLGTKVGAAGKAVNGASKASAIQNVYKSIKDAPKYPQGFKPRKNGTTKPNMNDKTLLEELRKVESGDWKKVYKDGYDEYGSKISIHYFESASGKVFDVKIKSGWSN